MIKRWKDLLHDRSQLSELILSFLASSSFLFIAPPFLASIESRKGIRWEDFIIYHLPSYDGSSEIIFILYSALLISFTWLMVHPNMLAVALKCLFLTNAVRYLFIYAIPLEPPVGLLPLYDPLLHQFVYKSQFITKDLFYSGHMANASLFFFCVANKKLKLYLGLSLVLMGIFLMMQRVHYSYDVIFAPIATFACYKVALKKWMVNVSGTESFRLKMGHFMSHSKGSVYRNTNFKEILAKVMPIQL